MTNHYVVAGEQRFEVVFANGDRQIARLISSDVANDPAVIQVDRLPEFGSHQASRTRMGLSSKIDLRSSSPDSITWTEKPAPIR